MLKITNLSAKADDKLILEDVNLAIKPGEVHVLLGPNGSGKTSLAQVMLGNPNFKVVSGRIKFQKKDITDLAPEKRVELGLALSFQDPPAIRGVPLRKLIELEGASDTKLELNEEILSSSYQELLDRDVNFKFSGGEKKISELVQILAMQPKLVVFDELDSGLDLKNIRKMAQLIQDRLISQGTAVLLITHTGKIIDELKPDWTHVMLDKTIVCTSKDYLTVKQTIKEQGYEQCRQCQHRNRPE